MTASAHENPDFGPAARSLRERSSRLGIGACAERGEESPAALAVALAMGCTVIDSAPHYHRGAQERCIGQALETLGASRGLAREQLVVNTQVGRVPELVEHTTRTLGFGRLHALVQERFVRRGVFAWQDLSDGDHTLAPNYIRFSIERTLAEMRLDRLDCVFLDAPRTQRKSVPEREYQQRLRAAVEALEDACDRGVISAYGVSTRERAEVEDLLTTAHDVAGDHARLAAVRVPFSLLRNSTYPIIRCAGAHGLYVFASGCLDGGVPQYQLSEPLLTHLGAQSDAEAALAWVLSAPHVGTAVLGSRDPRHIRQNFATAGLPRLGAELYADREDASQ